jgi:nitrate reductase gamma subunit
VSFNLAYYVSLSAVMVLILVPLGGVGVGLEALFGIIIPYLACIIFTVGIVYRVVTWARTPVPYRIPTTAGQEKTLAWIKPNSLDNPYNTWGVIGRMALEILAFRSLFRNLEVELGREPGFPEGRRLIYWSSKWLWVGALAFHYAFLVVILRHLRLFTEPVPWFVHLTESFDGFLQLYVPAVYLSGIVLLASLGYLLFRRILDPKLRYISLASDYFPLFLLLGIGVTGVLMRYFIRVDLVAAKELALGLSTLHHTLPEGIGAIFYIHLFLVSILLAYFPFSKLAHLAGIFFSMTRNMANNNRAVRHVNPWEYPVKVFSYMEQEDMFRKEMKRAGIPLEKDIEE